MVLRTDPFREFDRLTQQLLGPMLATLGRPTMIPMDAYREGDNFIVHFDMPGIDPDSIDLQVEQKTLTVKAERPPVTDGEMLVNERPAGTFTRQVFLGDTVDTEGIEAMCDNGVLTLRIPVAETAKPRKVEVGRGAARQIPAQQRR
ncbi:MAG TPA: Hsp20/alpha crystallin family protein [Actinopolymorphaceae bacterium]|jgi:HSP20 family protein